MTNAIDAHETELVNVLRRMPVRYQVVSACGSLEAEKRGGGFIIIADRATGTRWELQAVDNPVYPGSGLEMRVAKGAYAGMFITNAEALEAVRGVLETGSGKWTVYDGTGDLFS